MHQAIAVLLLLSVYDTELISHWEDGNISIICSWQVSFMEVTLKMRPSNIMHALITSTYKVRLFWCIFSSLTLLVWRQEGHLACKKVRRWFVGGIYLHLSPQLPSFLAPVKPANLEKWPLKQRGRSSFGQMLFVVPPVTHMGVNRT